MTNLEKIRLALDGMAKQPSLLVIPETVAKNVLSEYIELTSMVQCSKEKSFAQEIKECLGKEGEEFTRALDKIQEWIKLFGVEVLFVRDDTLFICGEEYE